MDTSGLMQRIAAIGIFALGLVIAAPAWATDQSEAVGSFDAEQSRDIEEIVHEYILKHPEVLVESLQRYQAQQKQAAEEKRREAANAVTLVDAEDHILGDPDAPVKLIEFSDFECPFCKRFHKTMKRIFDEYGSDGRVAWVYRHFPLDSLHSKARKEAQAAECANELGGNEAFWAYADQIFEKTPSNNRLDLALLPQFAEAIGLDRSQFEECLQGDARGGKYADHIEEDLRGATASGGTGTPFVLVRARNGKVFPISGAQPYRAVKSIIEAALKEN